MNPRRTINTVNKALVTAGLAMTLVKGEGYFYFVGAGVKDDAEGVYVYKLSDLSVEEWVSEGKDRMNEANKEMLK